MKQYELNEEKENMSLITFTNTISNTNAQYVYQANRAGVYHAYATGVNNFYTPAVA